MLELARSENAVLVDEAALGNEDQDEDEEEEEEEEEQDAQDQAGPSTTQEEKAEEQEEEQGASDEPRGNDHPSFHLRTLHPMSKHRRRTIQHATGLGSIRCCSYHLWRSKQC